MTVNKPKKKYSVIKGLEYNEYYRLYRRNNAAKNNDIQKRYYQKHRAKIIARQRNYRLRRKLTDPE